MEEGYAYLPIRDEAELIANLRTQLAALNGYDFMDAEWERFFKTSIAPESDGIVAKKAFFDKFMGGRCRKKGCWTKNVQQPFSMKLT